LGRRKSKQGGNGTYDAGHKLTQFGCKGGKAHLFPCWTLKTASGVAGPPAQRPAPLMSVLLKAATVGASVER